MVLKIYLVAGAGLVDGNAIHHMSIIICWGYCCMKDVTGINSNCHPGSVKTCNGC